MENQEEPLVDPLKKLSKPKKPKKRKDGTRGPEYQTFVRQYTEEEKAKVLALLKSNGYKIAQTAREAGVPYAAVANWAAGHGVNYAVRGKLGEQVKKLEDRLEDAAHNFLTALLEKLLKNEINARDMISALDMFTTKMQLLRGKSTTIPGQENVSGEEIFRRLRKFAEDNREQLAQPDGGTEERIQPDRQLPAPSTSLGAVSE